MCVCYALWDLKIKADARCRFSADSAGRFDRQRRRAKVIKGPRPILMFIQCFVHSGYSSESIIENDTRASSPHPILQRPQPGPYQNARRHCLESRICESSIL
jgi:hypothetical protein